MIILLGGVLKTLRSFFVEGFAALSHNINENKTYIVEEWSSIESIAKFIYNYNQRRLRNKRGGMAETTASIA